MSREYRLLLTEKEEALAALRAEVAALHQGAPPPPDEAVSAADLARLTAELTHARAGPLMLSCACSLSFPFTHIHANASHRPLT